MVVQDAAERVTDAVADVNRHRQIPKYKKAIPWQTGWLFFIQPHPAAGIRPSGIPL